MGFELFIGRRYLRAKRKETFISLITLLSVSGVTVGVMALIIVIAVMTGFESDLKNRILGVESHVVVMRHGGNFSEYRSVMDYINGLNGVEAVTPFIYSQVMLRSSTGLSGAILRGIEPDSAGNVIKYFKDSALKEMNRIRAESPGAPSAPGVILGEELARTLGVFKGDPIYLISPRGMVSPMGHMPAMKRLQVIDFFKSGMYEYDSSLIYIHMKDAQKTLRMGDSITGVEVKLTNVYDAKDVGKKIKGDLGFPYWTKDWMQMNRNLFSALKLEKTVMFIILTLIILVAAFNIASSLIMMVMEKTKDIAILKAMGAPDSSIRKIFVFKGMSIGAIGTTFGVALGCLLCALLDQYQFIKLPPGVYIISTLPVELQVADVLAIALSAMVICFLSTLYPAHQASKLNPVEAFRYG